MSMQEQSKQRLGALLQRQKVQPRAPAKPHIAPTEAGEDPSRPEPTSADPATGRHANLGEVARATSNAFAATR